MASQDVSHLPPTTAGNGQGTGYSSDPVSAEDLIFSSFLHDSGKTALWASLSSNPEYAKRALDLNSLPVYNQGALGACVPNAVSAALRFAWRKVPGNTTKSYDECDPSRLWLYYYARLMQGPEKVSKDGGCFIRDAIKVVTKRGVCSEKTWPYMNDIERKALREAQKAHSDSNYIPPDHRAAQEPPATAQDEAPHWFTTCSFSYYRIRDLSTDDADRDATTGAAEHAEATQCVDQMRCCIAEGFPVVFGFEIYADADLGATSLPPWRQGSVWEEYDAASHGEYAGGHAVLAVGYDDEVKRFKCLNSWGTKWSMGDGTGCFWLPYTWFTGRSIEKKDSPVRDLWVVRPTGLGVNFDD